MKKFIILITLLTATIAFSQGDEWSQNLLFNRVYENSKLLSYFEIGGDDTNVFGKSSYINDANEKVFELIKYDSIKDKMLPYITGTINNLKIDRSFQKDSTTLIYKMGFIWNAKNIHNNSIQKATVFETAIIDNTGRQIITTVQIKFLNSNKEMFCWNERYLPESDANENFVLPIICKVKKISDPKETQIFSDPEDKISYALWTKNGFYRYAKNGRKDKIEFDKLIDSAKEGNLSMLLYNDMNNKERLYTNTFLNDNTTYVSTLDIVPFPVDSENPIISAEAIIVWEKINLLKEYFNMVIKLEFIGVKGLSVEEILDMTAKVESLNQLIIELNKQKKS